MSVFILYPRQTWPLPRLLVLGEGVLQCVSSTRSCCAAMFFWEKDSSADKVADEHRVNAKRATLVLAFLLAVRMAPYVIQRLK